MASGLGKYNPAGATGSGSGYSGSGYAGGQGSKKASDILGGIFGTGGGSMGNTQPVPQQNLTPMNINVQQNPDMQGIIGEQKKLQQGLAAGNDIDAINSMTRNRDMMSGMMKEYGAQAGSRGFGGGSGIADIGRSRLLSQGSRNQTGLNAQLTSDARQQQRGLLGERANTIGSQANITNNQQNFALNQWQAQNQASLANRQLADQQQQNNFQNQMQLFNTMGNYFTGM